MTGAPSLDPVRLAQELIRVESVTPAGPLVFDIVERELTAAGFAVTRLSFAEDGLAPVENLFATRGEGRHLALCGHVDVVPPGDTEAWRHGPFDGAIEGDTLYGRGAQDMKGAVAAMICAAQAWAASGRPGRLSFLITGDEEGPSINGTRPLVAWAAARHPLDAAIVGEPTSRARLGDSIKIGRRGSLSATVSVHGQQGHVAYQQRALNPMPTLLAVGQALMEPLDDGTRQFAASNLEIVSMDVGNPAWNVIPASASLRFNVRFNDRWTVDSLKAELEARIAAVAGAERTVRFEGMPGEAFRVADQGLVDTITRAVAEATGMTPAATTGGGTSDARFIKDHCPVVEFGAVGDTMHQVNERTSCAELTRLTEAYRTIVDAVLGNG